MTVQGQRLRTPQSPPERAPGQPPVRPNPPAPAKPPARWPFWLGFLTSFLVLGLISIGLLLMSMGLNTFDLASLQNQEAAWTPPPPTPTALAGETIASASAAGSATGGQYAMGATLRNITDGGVFIRYIAGYLSKPESDKIGRIAAGGTVEVIGGPATADDLIWWQVRYRAGDGTVIEGWSAAQSTTSGLQFLAPAQ